MMNEQKKVQKSATAVRVTFIQTGFLYTVIIEVKIQSQNINVHLNLRLHFSIIKTYYYKTDYQNSISILNYCYLDFIVFIVFFKIFEFQFNNCLKAMNKYLHSVCTCSRLYYGETQSIQLRGLLWEFNELKYIKYLDHCHAKRQHFINSAIFHHDYHLHGILYSKLHSVNIRFSTNDIMSKT